VVGAPGTEKVPDSNGFYFDSNRHDFSSKVFLGRTIRESGNSEGEEALDILAQHPSTARHISYELAQYFVSDDPPKSLVDRLAKEFLNTRGDIRAVLNTLFHSPEFWDGQYFAKKFKTPYEYVISSVRASGYPLVNARPLLGMMQQLGMPLYGCLTPDGYKNTQAAWLNPSAMTQRLNFAVALAAGRLPLNQRPLEPAEQMGETKQPAMENQPIRVEPLDSTNLTRLLGNALSAETRATLDNSPGPFRAALILGSPDFMHR
jgi:uncharacterized protein (DUF1800 family)